MHLSAACVDLISLVALDGLGDPFQGVSVKEYVAAKGTEA